MQDEFEKEKTTLKQNLSQLQGELDQAKDSLHNERENTINKTDLTALTYAQAQPGEIEDLSEQKAHLEQVLRDIANCVIADTELSVLIPEAEALRSDGTRSPIRSNSPTRRSRRLRYFDKNCTRGGPRVVVAK